MLAYSPLDIARLEEARLASAMREIAPESRPFAGGVACRGAPGSWCNYAVGLAFDESLTREILDEFVEWYASKGIEPRIELHPFVSEASLAVLGEHGFVTRAYEFVYWRAIGAGAPPLPDSTHPHVPGLRVHVVDKADRAALREHTRIALSGFAPEGAAISEEDMELSVNAMMHPRSLAVLATVDGVPAGAAGAAVTPPIAGLFGASVMPPFRRMGVQTALLRSRLEAAADRGATIATIGSRPGSGTVRNALRLGFQVAYVKSVFVRPGPGLVPVTLA